MQFVMFDDTDNEVTFTDRGGVILAAIAMRQRAWRLLRLKLASRISRMSSQPRPPPLR